MFRIWIYPVDINGVMYVLVCFVVYAVWNGKDRLTYISSPEEGYCENIEFIKHPDTV